MSAPATGRRKETLEIPCGGADVARIVMEAIRRESEDGPGDVRIAMKNEGPTLRIELDAPDEVELRASRFSMLRLSDAARRVAHLARKG